MPTLTQCCRAAATPLFLTLASFAVSTYAASNSGPPKAPQNVSSEGLLAEFLRGPMRGVENIVFAARGVNPTDGHWYANFGYYAHDPNRKAYAEGARLYRLNLVTRQLTTLLADSRGGVRDPQVSYDGKKILFSYRKGGTDNYHLYELDLEAANAGGAISRDAGAPRISSSGGTIATVPLTLPSPQGEGFVATDPDSFNLPSFLPRRETILPLPQGEGRGEAERNTGLTPTQRSETKGQSPIANPKEFRTPHSALRS